jgi:hypothetical protein
MSKDIVPQDIQTRITALEEERQTLLQEPYNRTTFQAYQQSGARYDRLRQIEQALQHVFAEKRQRVAERDGIHRPE